VHEVEQLLGRGVCLNFLPPDPPHLPPLHAVLRLPAGDNQLALAQLLLVNGADPELADAGGRTAVQMAADEGGGGEVGRLLRAWAGQEDSPASVTTFHRYVFEDDESELGAKGKENIQPVVRCATGSNSLKFLEKVASIFQGQVGWVGVCLPCMHPR
jgi:hypothetical protein